MATKPTQDRKKSSPFSLATSWSSSPRNPAWDALWQRLANEAIRPALTEVQAADPPTGPSKVEASIR